MLSESIRNHEIENKHLVEIIYAKDQEIKSLQNHIDGLMLHVRNQSTA